MRIEREIESDRERYREGGVISDGTQRDGVVGGRGKR